MKRHSAQAHPFQLKPEPGVYVIGTQLPAAMLTTSFEAPTSSVGP
jgi:hypothetical protein